ncbi:MAG TPA: RHS repeat-associated core domain-containing protein [Luteibacter sp.]|uniref:RHS repeat-associated core domain-containing protein n=1 Tax=Luteibacter sp. TaxID=1886636 RepID=UPI002C76D1B9|nr:RHS repeat-associated core domain-containing protein [Luteibacter sp.]HVI56034.1 RHS repeat-associated core domain-containing protein [Luteibacter sp.]
MDSGDGGPNGDGEGHQKDDSTPTAGDPANAQTGAKILQATDYSDTPWLEFSRFYTSSDTPFVAHIGKQWRHSFDRSLQLLGNPVSTAVVLRPDGSTITFLRANGTWTSSDSTAQRLSESTDGSGIVVGYHLFVTASRHDEAYDTSGKLVSVVDPAGQGIALTYSDASTPTTVAPAAGLLLGVVDKSGRALSFVYDSAGRLATLGLPDGTSVAYTYSSEGSLGSATYAGGQSIKYFYNESGLFSSTSLPLLTGIVDETGNRYSTTAYGSQQRTVSMSFSGGSNGTQFAYNADGTTTVTSALGNPTILSFASGTVLSRLASVDKACNPGCAEPYQSRTYDTVGNPATTTDFLGQVTETRYNSYGQLTSSIEAKGTDSQRTTTITWDDTLRAPTLTTIADKNGVIAKKTGWAYDASGKVLARCEVDAASAPSYACAATGTLPAGVRRWSFNYCTGTETGCARAGLLKSVQGPRTDVVAATTYGYYTDTATTTCGTPGSACHRPGDIRTVTDALGHVTTYVSYDAAGRVTRSTDANGTVTDTTYTPRGWIATRTVGGAKTTFDYMPYGAVANIQDPDGVTLTYSYDQAHRLTKVTNNLNESVVFTLDAAGNITNETVTNASGATVRARSQKFDALGRLTAMIDGLNNTILHADTASSYDANGEMVLSSDANGIQRQRGLDPLRRLVSTVQNYSGSDAATKNTANTIAYDAMDHVVGITDPGALNTLYTYDGLGNRTSLQSPDTGTSNDTFDAAGNRLTHKDAKGVVATSNYDALNRRVSLSYVDATLNASYKYDEANSLTGCAASSPIGRLTRIVENAVTTTYCYDGRGNVIQKKQLQGTTTDVTTYAYTLGDRLTSEVTPDSTSVTYTRNALGNITAIRVAPAVGASVTAVSAATYLPFGPVLSYTLGNGQVITRTYNANYAVTDVVSPALALHFSRDAMGNISAIGNASGANPATEAFGYDPLYRLTTVTDGATAVEGFTYNQTGDRLSKTGTGLATGSYIYTSGTHQLNATGAASRANDANGSTTATTVAGQVYGFGYNGRGRLTVVQASGQTVGTYTYNVLGQRVLKVATLPQATTQRYGYDENNQLIGEYTSTAKRDTVWMSDIPVAVVDVNGTTSAVSYIHADHLGTPRAVTNSAGTIIWTWAYKGNPFGESLPTATAGFTFNLRFPGQYFDAESGLHYNAHRAYEPATGRYLESDPSGLKGGISTYLYAMGQPTLLTDRLGLDPKDNRHLPYYPYGMFTDPAQVESYPSGPGEEGEYPYPMSDSGGLGLGVGLAAEVGVGLSSLSAGIIVTAFVEATNHTDYANEPYVQHTMPRQ